MVGPLAKSANRVRDDPDYAHSWQCNIAMPILDGAKGKLTHAEANAIAENMMRHLFEVKRPNDRTERRGRPGASALANDVARPRSLQ